MPDPQRLAGTQYAFRIGDAAGTYPIFDAGGAKLAPGRWHKPEHPVIYSSEHYSTAMLEKLVHATGVMPPNQHWLKITLPRGLSYEVATAAHVPGWDSKQATASCEYGFQWAQEARSAILYVPSIVARMESNVLINPAHPEFSDIEPAARAEPIWWDDRLYQ
jgi:RES domain-containing protein